eukprot:g21242.t1
MAHRIFSWTGLHAVLAALGCCIASGCSCIDQLKPNEPLRSPAARLRQQPYVFAGEVVSVAPTEKEPTEEQCAEEAEVWACHSLKSWKKCSQQHQAEVMPDSELGSQILDGTIWGGARGICSLRWCYVKGPNAWNRCEDVLEDLLTPRPVHHRMLVSMNIPYSWVNHSAAYDFHGYRDGLLRAMREDVGNEKASTLELIFHFPTAHDASRALSLAQDHTWHFGRAAQHAKLPEPLRALLTQMEELDTAQAFQSSNLHGLESLDSVLKVIQGRIDVTQNVSQKDVLMRHMQSPDFLKPILDDMEKYAQSWRGEIASEKQAAVTVLREAYAEILACKEDLLSEVEASNDLQASLPNRSLEHRQCRLRQSQEHQKVLLCEAALKGKTAVRQTQCNNYNDNYNKIPQPNNVWAAVCEVRQEGQGPKEYFGHQLAFWDALLLKHDEAEKKCQNATADELAKEKECLGIAANRAEITRQCDAVQERLVGQSALTRNQVQLHEILNLECVLQVMRNEPQDRWAAGSTHCSEQKLDTTLGAIAEGGIDCRDWSILQDNTNYIRRKILLLAKARKLLKKVTSWRLTLIYYVADGPWDVHKDGGALQVCLSDPRRAPSSTAEALSHPFFTVAPDCDTLVAFWSHTMFHAVLPEIFQIGRDLTLEVTVLKYEVVDTAPAATGLAAGIEALKARVSLAKSGQHVEYVLQVRMNGSSPWSLRRRFQQISTMHQSLRRRVASLPELPAKSVVRQFSGVSQDEALSAMAFRLTYRRQCRYNTKSNKQRVVKTPGGRAVFQVVKKKAKGPICGDCGKALIGLPRLRPIEYARLKKREKRVNRAYGGSRCAGCVRSRIVRAFLIEEQKCVKQVIAEKISQQKMATEGGKKPKKK